MPALPTVNNQSVAEARRQGFAELAGLSQSPRLDVDLLLSEVLGLDRLWLITEHDRTLTAEKLTLFNSFIQRRKSGEPVAYLTGRKAFRMIELAVDRRVMVPRPETEWIVSFALKWLERHLGQRRVLDLGAGSGAIAISLAVEIDEMRNDVEIVASDVSQDALDVARTNLEAYGCEDRVELRNSDLLVEISGRFDLILANLPYLRNDQRHWSTKREPEIALYSGDDGFDLYRRFFTQVANRLIPGGLIVAEIDPLQSAFGAQFVRETTGMPVSVAQDVAGEDRYLLVGAKQGR